MSHCFKLPQRLRFDSVDNSVHNEGGNSCPEDIVKQSERKEVQIDTSRKAENSRRMTHEFKRNLTPLGGMSTTESKTKRQYAGLNRGNKIYRGSLSKLKDTTSLRSQRLNNSNNSLPTITEERKERIKTPKNAYGFDFFEKYSSDSVNHRNGKSFNIPFFDGSCEDNLGDQQISDESIGRLKMIS